MSDISETHILGVSLAVINSNTMLFSNTKKQQQQKQQQQQQQQQVKQGVMFRDSQIEFPTVDAEAISEGAVNGPEYGFNGKYYVKSLVNGTIPAGLPYYQGLKLESAEYTAVWHIVLSQIPTTYHIEIELMESFLQVY
ncbi:hypothetical protein M0802_004509 [Mischocyttarus mexicanus]|nr:hypothetical protein M0802_004509 [Mischocyttarus mexicanus]